MGKIRTTLDSLPDLSRADRIGLDTETYDPDLKSKGPGVRRDGRLIGISVSVPEGQAWYIPFGHVTGQQYSPDVAKEWAKRELTRPNQPKVGANLLYDLDYLTTWGVNVEGPFLDVQVAEPLLNENRREYNLDALAVDYLNEHKNEEGIRQVAHQMSHKGAPQKILYKMDPLIVGEYARPDANLPLRILDLQTKRLEEENLTELFRMETDLIPVLLAMRQRGVRIDEEAARRVEKQVEREQRAALAKMSALAGHDVQMWAADSIARACTELGIEYPRTPTGKPSFQKEWLASHEHELPRLVAECRKMDKFNGTFIRGSILDTMVNGRIHTQFNQLKSDDYGAVTGRFSSSNPNLQFIPSRDEILGPMVRSLFLPEIDEDWGRADYSQIELRILAHYARGLGASQLRQAFNENPSMDLHQWCADVVGLEGSSGRKKAKTINFGVVYGMGVDKTAVQLGMTKAEAQSFLNTYYAKLPFVKETLRVASRIAEKRGYVMTMMGRRRRFDDRKLSYKALNAVIQGTAADMMKKAMVDVWKSGVCDVLGAPLLTVHDELDVSIPRTREGAEAFREMVRLMEQALTLNVPVIADAEIGTSWGTVK